MHMANLELQRGLRILLQSFETKSRTESLGSWLVHAAPPSRKLCNFDELNCYIIGNEHSMHKGGLAITQGINKIGGLAIAQGINKIGGLATAQGINKIGSLAIAQGINKIGGLAIALDINKILRRIKAWDMSFLH